MVVVEVVVESRWARGSMIACVTTSAAHRTADRLFASRDGILGGHYDGQKKRKIMKRIDKGLIS